MDSRKKKSTWLLLVVLLMTLMVLSGWRWQALRAIPVDASTANHTLLQQKVQPQQLSPHARVNLPVNANDASKIALASIAAAEVAQPSACMSFETLAQTWQWQKNQEWLDSLGGGIFWDIAFDKRESRLAPYLDYAPEKLVALIGNGDPAAKLVQAYINYEKARKLEIDPANDERVLSLMRQSRELWTDAIIDGGYTVALVSIGQSYYVESEILKREGKLSYARQVELEKLSYRYGEAAESLIEGLDENFYTFGEMMAPVDDLQAALEETVSNIEAERARRGLPSLRTHIPPERAWIVAQGICDES